MSNAQVFSKPDTAWSIGQFLFEWVEQLNPTAFVALLNPSGTVLHVNRPALVFIDAALEEVVGKAFIESPWWRACETARRCLRRAIKLGRRAKPSSFMQRACGSDARWHTRHFILIPICDSRGRVAQLMASSIPVDPELPHQVEDRNGLHNRSEMRRRLKINLQRGKSLDLMLIGLDRFKRINDELGQDAGDALLILASQRLHQAVPEAAILAGFGGDEFAVALDTAQRTAATERVLEAFVPPFELVGREVFVTCSIGCATAPTSGGDVNELVRQAGSALQRAKLAGRNCLQVFSDDPEIGEPDALMLDSALRRAIDRQQLDLHYQPQIDLSNGQVVGAEALLRWHHPEMGAISPGRFIPIAEESSLILAIGDWALRQAIRTAAAWQRDGLARIRVAVNLSGRQVLQPELADRIDQLLDESGLDPRWLAVELTESMLVDNFAQASATLIRLRARGIEVAIDDFGTGYSGLSYLRELPVDVVKIDRCFIPDVARAAGRVSMTRALIQLAHSLQMRVVAEGVETEHHRQLLADQRCDIAQGFLFSAALPAEAFRELLRPQEEPPATSLNL